MNNIFQIAIDGPVAAGKGTVSRLVAERLGFLYVDTGAMYRVAALLATRNQVDWQAEAQIVQLLEQTKLELRLPTENEKDGRLITVILNGEDVSWAIRTEEMSMGASAVSQHKRVREVLVYKQQEIAAVQNVVMEGRDITYRVLPQAQIKIYLTGSDVVRAKRRHLQLLTKGQDLSYEQVLAELQRRDEQDKNRVHDPLQIVSEAWVIDTSDLEIEKVVEMIVERAKSLQSH